VVDINIPVKPMNPTRLRAFIGSKLVTMAYSVVAPYLPPLTEVATPSVGVAAQFYIKRLTPPTEKSINSIHFTTEVIPLSIDPSLARIANDAMDEMLALRCQSDDDSSEYDQLIAGNQIEHCVARVRIAFIVPKHADFNQNQSEFFRHDMYGFGCWGEGTMSTMPSRLRRYLDDPPSNENNCFFACLWSRYPEEVLSLDSQICRFKNRRDTLRAIRKACGITHMKILSGADLQTASRRLRKRLVIYTIEPTPDVTGRYDRHIQYSCQYGTLETNSEPIELLSYNNHIAIITNLAALTKMRSCVSCQQWIRNSNTKHWESCRSRPPRDLIRKSTPRGRAVQKDKKLIHSEYTDDDKVWYADLETFTNDSLNGVMRVYSSAIVSVKDLDSTDPLSTVRCDEFYGQGGFDRFMTHIIELEGTIVFYNGSRFDLFFVFSWLIHHQVKIKSYMKEQKGNKIINLEVNKVRFWDLCLFTMGSLHDTCKAFKVPPEYCKKDFDHRKIKSWQDVNTHRAEVVHYNSYDVLALGYATRNFCKTIFRLYQYNPTQAFTLSHMAYGIWTNIYADYRDLRDIHLPDRDQYSFIRKGLYGGRCCPQRAMYVSTQYFEGRDEYGDFRDYQGINDYLVYLDVVSLYPYSAVIAEFPTGEPTWIVGEGSLGGILRKATHTTLTTQEIAYVKTSIAEVDVACPDDLITPFLFARNAKGGLTQNLKPKNRQVYDGATLLEASRLGYRVLKVYRYLKYPKLGNPLRAYMEYAFSQKDASAKGSCEYACHKYLMNGLTGKFSQAMIETNWSIAYDDRRLQKLHEKGTLKRIEWIHSEEDLSDIAIALEVESPTKKPTKPLQLGVSILAHSRVLMSVYTDYLKAYKDPTHASYYGDTDSMIVHANTYNEALARNNSDRYLGDQFGRLSNEYKNCKIVKAVFLSPKTYCIELVDASGKSKWSMRAKGVPQKLKDITVDEYVSKYDHDVPDNLSEEEDLKTLTYTLVSKDNEIISSRTVLGMPYYEEVLLYNSRIVVRYGSLKRALHCLHSGNQPSRITLQLGNERTISSKWWTEGKRSKLEVDALYCNITYPPGHKKYDL
jgi:hypothetical protein